MLTDQLHLCSRGSELQAGTSAATLPFPLGEALWGYLDPAQVAEGTHDPLLVRSACFYSEGMCLGLVNLEAGRVPLRTTCEALRLSARAYGYDDLVFTATHTHSAPYVELDDAPFDSAMREAILQTLAQAKAALRPVHLELGHFDYDLGSNRRVVEHGVGYMRWRNLERTYRGETDDRATVLCFREQSGAPVFTLIHYACHPVIAGPENRLYTGDWPGVMCREVEAALGGACAFMLGAAGDINPWCDKMGLDEGAYELIEQEGGRMAALAVATVREHSRRVSLEPGLRFWRGDVLANLRYDYAKPALAALFRGTYGIYFDLYLAALRDPVRLPVSALFFGADVSLNFGPGEFFVASQVELTERSSLPVALLCGYADDYCLYIPPLEASFEGGYGADTSVYAAPGTAECIVNQFLLWQGVAAGRMAEPQTPADFIPREWPALIGPAGS